MAGFFLIRFIVYYVCEIMVCLVDNLLKQKGRLWFRIGVGTNIAKFVI